MISRRHLMIAAGGAAMFAAGRGHTAETKAFDEDLLKKSIARIEAASRGRLGVALRDTGSGRHFAHRGGERFPMCSTFKFLLAAAVLARVDRGEENLDRGIRVKATDILPNSPTSEKFVGREATVDVLCEAAVIQSDNGAANLLLASIDGPTGLTRFARAIGDEVTRLDRMEMELNEAIPGDPRDTTTPNAMLADLDRLVLGDVLTNGSREKLAGWLIDNRTGDARLRAGLPRDWRVGDKTGTGPRGTANDIAVIWPPSAAPLLLTSYLTGCPLDARQQSAVHADVARAIAETIEA